MAEQVDKGKGKPSQKTADVTVAEHTELAPVEEEHARSKEASGEGTSAGAPTGEVAEAGPTAELTLEEALAEKEALEADLRNQILYLHAELDNFKKRTEKRYSEALVYASEPVLKDLLPVLDNLERAVDHGREAGSEGHGALLEGLRHVIDQFVAVLGQHGVEKVPAQGEKFDPEVHEAMLQVPGDENGRVADVYETGYKLKGRLLRPAKVTVTKVAPE